MVIAMTDNNLHNKKSNVNDNTDKARSVHSGHRERMRNKYFLNGKDVFEMHEMLEMLLYYAVQRKNTCDLAHLLLNEFGSLSAVLDAPVDVLTNFGLTEHQVMLLKLIPDFAELYINDKHNNSDKIINDQTLGEYIKRKYISREKEEVLLLLADAKFKEIFCGFVAKGSINQSPISIRNIVDLAMRYNASAAIIAHNHPSGVAMPSDGDIIATRNIKYALQLVGVKLLDHFVVADNDCVSIAQSRLAPDIFEVPDEL